MKCNSIIKKYPNGLVKVKKTKFNFEIGSKTRKDLMPNDTSEYGQYRSLLRYADYMQYDRVQYSLSKAKDNMIKTKEKIYDIANANDFNYFITLTYASEKCDRYSFNETSKKVRQFMNNYRKRHDQSLKYLIVHEQHKDGAYHYHGLIYIENIDKMVDSIRKDKKGNVIYNWEQWHNGFSTATKINNIDACRYYILKYIDKDIDKDYVKGQRRFYYSQNCEKPNREVAFDYPTDDLLFSYESNYSLGYQNNVVDISDLKNKLGKIEIVEE